MIITLVSALNQFIILNITDPKFGALEDLLKFQCASLYFSLMYVILFITFWWSS